VAVVFGSASTGLAPATRTNSAVPVPTGVASGDLIVIAYYQEVLTAPTAPAGFTEITTFSPALTDAAEAWEVRVYYKFATGADSGTYTVTHSSRFTAAVAARYTGGPTNIEVLGSAVSTTGTVTINGTTTQAAEVVIGVVGNFTSATSLGTLSSTPAGTKRSDQGNVVIFDGTQASAGSVTSGALVWSPGADQPRGALLGVYTNPATSPVPDSIVSGAVVPSPALSTTLTATPNSLPTGAVVPSPSVSSVLVATPASIASGAVVPAPTVGNVLAVVPTSIPSGEVVPGPAASLGPPSQILAPASIVSGEVVPDASAMYLLQFSTPDAIGSGESVPPLAVTVQQPTTVFIPPITQRRVPLDGNGALVALMNFGLAVYRIDGQWFEAEFPPPSAWELADLFFEGGHMHSVDDATAALLNAAGYETSEVFL
jgi:hypothetical protein